MVTRDSSPTASQRLERRQRLRSRRLAIIGVAVVLLVTLPILPLRFIGIPGPDLSPHLAQVSRVTDLIWDKLTPDKPEERAADANKQLASYPPVEHATLLEKATQELQSQVSRSPQEPSLQNRLGMLCLSLGEIHRAAGHFQRAVELCRFGLANVEEKRRILEAKGNLIEAARAMVEASRLNVELVAAHSNLARVYERLGQHDKVLAELDLLNKDGAIIPGSTQKSHPAGQPAALSPTVSRLLARAEGFMRARRYPEAIQEYRNVIAVDPGVSLAHHQLGIASALTCNPAGAVESLQEAVRLEPANALAHNNLGLALQMVGNMDRAQQEFETAMALDHRLADPALNLGNLHSSYNRYNEARQAYEKAVLANPRSAVAHNNLATMLSMEGKHHEAAGEFQKALTLSPDMASAHYGLGLALFNSKSYLPAIGAFKRALALDPSLVGVHEKLEQCHRKVAQGSAFGFN